MDGELRMWLLDKKLSHETLKILEKEDFFSADVISLLKEEDLQSLASLSIGQRACLREARDALKRGEFTKPSPHQSKPQSVGVGGVQALPQQAAAPQYEQIVPSTAAGYVADSHQAAQPVSVQPPGQEYDKVQRNLEEADRLQNEGRTDEAVEKAKQVREGAGDILEGIRRKDKIPHLSSDIGVIDNVVTEFKSGDRTNFCCSLL